MGEKVRVAVIQTGSVLFNKNASVDKVVSWLNRAAQEQVRLVLFPEAFIPGYPRGMHFGAIVGSRTPGGRKSWEQYYHNAIDLTENELSPVAEGRCFILSANQYIRHKDYPVDIVQAETLNPEQTACRGGSVIVSPSGDVIAGPLYDREGILLADLDMDAVVRGKMDLDVAGHYNRPDVFRFDVPDQPDTKDTG